MNNFAREIEDEAGKEPILGAVLSASRRDKSIFHKTPLPKILEWSEAKPILSYSYDDGYGGQDCHSIYAWTKSKGVFVHEYDGSTCVVSVPRNPTRVRPTSI